MNGRLRCAIVLMASAGLLVACGDDGPSGRAAGSEVVEIQVPTGGDEGDGTDAHDATVDDTHDATNEVGDDATPEDTRDAAPAEVGHDATVEDSHDAMVEDSHDAMVEDSHDAMTEDSHDATADDSHDAMTEDSHDATADDSHDATADDDAAASTENVIEVEMVEFGFITEATSIPIGVPVTFRFVNTGVLPHEAMFGSLHEQSEYAEAGNHDGGHGEASHHGEVAALTLEAGETADIVLEFASPDEVWIGCHLPGHYDAGMKAELVLG